MNFFGKTDIGTTRDNNEDCFGIYEIGENAYLFAVCDGMGGESAGEVASRLALDSFSDSVCRLCQAHLTENRLSLSLSAAELILSNAATHANNALLEYQKKNPETKGMGTTLIAAIVMDGSAIAWLNLGDSRLYTIDKKDILQVSKDHSYIQYMIDTGEITSEEAKTSPIRNLITRAVGIAENAQPDIDLFELSEAEKAETMLLLCSDGLSGSLPEEECMEIALREGLTPEEKAELFIEAAKEHGSTDNITLVLVELW